MLPKELVDLIAEVGRVDTERHEQAEREHAALMKNTERYERTKLAAIPDATAVFAWADGPVGMEIRALMSQHGLDALPLSSLAISLVPEPGALRANNFGRYGTGRRINVSSPEQLIQIAGIDEIRVLLSDILSGAVFDKAIDNLRKEQRTTEAARRAL
jgi:hypothetical protein